MLSDYELSDFLLFSKSIYLDLLASYHLMLWPYHYVFSFWLGALFLALVVSNAKRFDIVLVEKLVRISFCLAFVFIAKFFFIDSFQTINWAASYIAYLFFIQSALVLYSIFLPVIKIKSNVQKTVFSYLCVVLCLLTAAVNLWQNDYELILLLGINPEITMLAFVFYSVSFFRKWWVMILPFVYLCISLIMHITLFSQ